MAIVETEGFLLVMEGGRVTVEGSVPTCSRGSEDPRRCGFGLGPTPTVKSLGRAELEGPEPELIL